MLQVSINNHYLNLPTSLVNKVTESLRFLIAEYHYVSNIFLSKFQIITNQILSSG